MSEDEVLGLLDGASTTSPLATVLKTDERVLARVTDGIYRHPASALRELIANAYDADATRVTIRTDRPRFERITVDDDGIGMSQETLLHLLYHIGGSAKRTQLGTRLGMTSPGNSQLSPGGRPLIGKIGIGIFSVAQLTQSFQIVTKQRGDSHWNVASVLLKQYSDSSPIEAKHDGQEGGGSDNAGSTEYEAGKVLVWRQEAADAEVQGTSIILTSMRPQTRETLRSQDVWEAVEHSEADTGRKLQPPKYHIGAMQPGSDSFLQRIGKDSTSSLPWARAESQSGAFDSLVRSVWNAIYEGEPNPRLDRLFDYYLKMAWNLALAVPLPYVKKHPFDLDGTDNTLFYRLLDGGRRADRIDVSEGSSLREAANLGNEVASVAGFKVFLDDLELKRPLDMTDLPPTQNALRQPIMFAGSYREEFPGIDPELSGGPLAFQSYLLWAPKVAPVESQGVLIRVNEASGTSFDPDFLLYPVTERQRMAQITCEVFITEGFDGALNIDRESFNFAHPHVVALTHWVHRSLRTVIAEQKRLGKAARTQKRAKDMGEQGEEAQDIIDELWRRVRGEDAGAPPVTFSTTERAAAEGIRLNSEKVLGEFSGANWVERRALAQLKVGSIARLLDAYELLDTLEQSDRDELMAAISRLLRVFE
ncbi:ATP-binding protein [Nocardioides sp. YR527]|uniref:ATP-binding protein n=1 Tax=Nocardioides sp. YR527 TaxID=1881028 RepID=UPI000B80F5DD|nr:ATP-binding protein [Nocardioides sp. YR527]